MENSSTSEFMMIKIGWADAMENQKGWMSLDESIEWADTDNWIVHQIGWLIKENKDYILLCSTISQENQQRDRQFSGLFKIPKPWVQYMETINP